MSKYSSTSYFGKKEDEKDIVINVGNEEKDYESLRKDLTTYFVSWPQLQFIDVGVYCWSITTFNNFNFLPLKVFLTTQTAHSVGDTETFFPFANELGSWFHFLLLHVHVTFTYCRS